MRSDNRNWIVEEGILRPVRACAPRPTNLPLPVPRIRHDFPSTLDFLTTDHSSANLSTIFISMPRRVNRETTDGIRRSVLVTTQADILIGRIWIQKERYARNFAT